MTLTPRDVQALIDADLLTDPRTANGASVASRTPHPHEGRWPWLPCWCGRMRDAAIHEAER